MDEPHPAIDESRWQQLTHLLCQLFKASACAVLQYQEDQAKLLTVKQSKNVGLHPGAIEKIETLKARLSNPTLPTETLWQQGLIEFPLYWPGGFGFGAVLLVCDRRPPNLESCQTLAAPIFDLLQSELKVYRHAKQIERLSFQDELTQMLNTHGFNLMAPRQLNLSRRLGSNAGLVVMKNGTQYQGDEAQEKLRALSQVVYDNLREADLAARIDDQIVLLAFVDSEANLDSLVTRLRKQFARKLEPQRVLSGHSFFTPDSHLGLGPMMEQANAELEVTRARLYPKPSVSRTEESEADVSSTVTSNTVLDTDTQSTQTANAYSADDDTDAKEPEAFEASQENGVLSPGSTEEPGSEDMPGNGPNDDEALAPALNAEEEPAPDEAGNIDALATAQTAPAPEAEVKAGSGTSTENIETSAIITEIDPAPPENSAPATQEPAATSPQVSEEVEAAAPKAPKRARRSKTTIKLTPTKKAKAATESTAQEASSQGTATEGTAAESDATAINTTDSDTTEAKTTDTAKAKGSAGKNTGAKSSTAKSTATKSTSRRKKATTSSKSSTGTSGGRRRKATKPPEE